MLLYDAINITKVPKNKKVLMSKKQDCVYYRNNNKKIPIKYLNNHKENPIEKFSFLKFSLTKESDKVFIELNITKYDIIEDEIIKLSNNVYFIKLMSKCYDVTFNEYMNNFILDIYKTIINKYDITEKLNDTKIDKWINKIEINDTEFYYCEHRTNKIGNNFFDIDTGKIVKIVNKKKITINGGIIFDKSNYKWINDIIKKINDLDSYLESKKTLSEENNNLILCEDVSMSNIWYSRIKEINDTKKIIIFNKEIDCEIYKNYDYVIANNNNIEYLSNLKWKRAIMNEKLLNNKDIINLNCHNKYLHIGEILLTKHNIKQIISMISSDNDINFPLLNKNEKNINSISKLIFVYPNSLKNIEIIDIIIKTDNTDIIITNYYENNKRDDIFIYIDGKYVNKSFDKNVCSICLCEDNELENNDNICILNCGHIYCVTCFFDMLKYQNNCAICRKEIDIYDVGIFERYKRNRHVAATG